MLLCEKAHRTHRSYHLVTFRLAYIYKTIDCVHHTRSKSLRNGTEHSVLCFAQNRHFRIKRIVVLVGNLACQQWKFLFDRHGMKAKIIVNKVYWPLFVDTVYSGVHCVIRRHCLGLRILMCQLRSTS